MSRLIHMNSSGFTFLYEVPLAVESQFRLIRVLRTDTTFFSLRMLYLTRRMVVFTQTWFIKIINWGEGDDEHEIDMNTNPGAIFHMVCSVIRFRSWTYIASSGLPRISAFISWMIMSLLLGLGRSSFTPYHQEVPKPVH